MNNGVYVMSVGVFDEVHESMLPPGEGPIVMPHERDMIWMFGKMYKRSFIDKYGIHFHESSRANEDNGFNTWCRLCIIGMKILIVLHELMIVNIVMAVPLEIVFTVMLKI